MSDPETKEKKKLFWACFIALVATSFVFGLRANIIGDWQEDFGLSEAQKGTILGVGLWPFAISIIVFSLIIDSIGYKTAAYFAMGCHVASLLLTLFAEGVAGLYWSVFLIAIANGTVEAFVNPVVATIYRKEKAKWLNILHAGWPAGLALGAFTATVLGDAGWQLKYALCFLPVVVYAVLILPRKFPVSERVEANITYRQMLGQVGAVGFLLIAGLLVLGVSQMLESFDPDLAIPSWVAVVVGVAASVAAAVYTKSLGHWMFLLILVTMGPLATTELGTDSWMPDLLSAELSPAQAGWIFIYVSVIMTVLRFYAGVFVHRFSPIGLLVLSAAVAIVGLVFLSQSAGWIIVAAATIYALGKTFLWSTTLGLVSEQFPKGGALTLNGVSAVGVLGMGILGTPILGGLQDEGITRDLRAKHPAIHEKVVTEPRRVPFLGETSGVDEGTLVKLPETQQEKVERVRLPHKKATFLRVAVLPTFLLLCYLVLFFYFRSRGGYHPVEIGHEDEGPSL